MAVCDIKLQGKLQMNIQEVIAKEFPQHPFTTIPTTANYETIMSNYLAMSQAFPYLQAGSESELFFHYMNKNQDVPEQIEMTAVVGNFLCWDETGGLYLMLASGMKGLPRLLETRRFHCNLLKKDCAVIFDHKIEPDYSAVTKKYLLQLYKDLSEVSHIDRVACMVSFEMHANNMIDALWGSLASHFNISKDKLSYFMTHVGGDDPAEAYHVEMTTKLIEKIVPVDQKQAFVEKVTAAYKRHYDWCQAVIDLGRLDHYYRDAS